jgi:hypothetical protein
VFSTARLGLGCLALSAFLVGSGAGCSESGGVHVALQLPGDTSLSPLTQGLSRLELDAESPGQPAQNPARDVPLKAMSGQTIAFGDLDIASGVRLAVRGFSASGRLVGYGRALAPVSITAGSDVNVDIRLRRPFAYIAGGPTLYACDTTVEGDDFIRSLDAVSTPDAVATTPDGNSVLAVGHGQLSIISTSRHQPAGVPATMVNPGAKQLAVSPDARWAVVVHNDPSATGISIIDLSAAARASTSPTFVKLDAPGGVAVGTDTAWVLSSPSVAGSDECSTPSLVIPVALPAGTMGTPIALASGARDLAVSEDGSALFVAEPCLDQIVKVTDGGRSQVRLVMMPGPTQVAVAGDRVWGLGRDATPSEHLVLTSVSAASGAGQSVLALSAQQELAQSNDLTTTGQVTEVRLDADRMEGTSLSVLPDGHNVVILVHGTYHAAEVARDLQVGGQTYRELIVPKIDLETYEYQLVDATTAAVTQRLRTSCNLTWEHGVALLDSWACASAQGQVTSSQDFIARQATVLYGAH